MHLTSDAVTVLHLKKSLYGLRQAPREWNKMLHEFLLAQKLQQSVNDPCLYFIPGKLWVAIWVDDFIVMAADTVLKNSFKTELSQRFKMRDLGPLHHFLGMEVTRDRKRGTLQLTSVSHTSELIDRFGMQDARSVATPLPPKTSLLPTGANESDVLTAEYPYRSLIGSLQYLAMTTRPDISFAVSLLARFQARPSKQHWDAAKHVVRYLKGTLDMGLTYSAQSSDITVSDTHDSPSVTQSSDPPVVTTSGILSGNVLYGYVDASWAEDVSTRRSQTGYVFMYAGAAVHWSTKLQTTVALSSTEAEYLALSSATKEGLYLRLLFSDLTGYSQQSVVLCEDNQSTMKMAQRLSSSERTKHIDVRHHFIRDYVNSGVIQLRYVSTGIQAADCLTKPLDKIKVVLFRQIILGATSKTVSEGA